MANVLGRHPPLTEVSDWCSRGDMTQCSPRVIRLVPLRRTQASRHAISLDSARSPCSDRSHSCQEWIIDGKWLPLRKERKSLAFWELGDLLAMKVALGAWSTRMNVAAQTSEAHLLSQPSYFILEQPCMGCSIQILHILPSHKGEASAVTQVTSSQLQSA